MEPLNLPKDNLYFSKDNQLNQEARADLIPKYEFGDYAEITGINERWNQQFPYQLLVVKYSADTDAFVKQGSWVFTLPIPPESLQISTPFAINTSVTLGGIIEEHNGAPIRNITLSGTTGVFPGKGTYKSKFPPGSISGGILAGAEQKVKNTVNAGVNTARTIVGGDRIPFASNVLSAAEIQSVQGYTSGYYQFLLLQRFLEDYISIKKTEKGKDLVLAFANWKDFNNTVMLVTPVAFNLTRNAGRPFEYLYSISLKAWKRVPLNKIPPMTQGFGYSPIRKNADYIARALGALQQAQATIKNAQSILAAGIKDLGRVLTVGKQLKMTLMALLNPNAWLNMNVDDYSKAVFSSINRELGHYKIFREDTTSANIARNPLGKQAKVIGEQSATNSPTRIAINAATAGKDAIDTNQPINNLNLSQSTLDKIRAEFQEAIQKTRKDWENDRDHIMAAIATYSAAVGADHDTFNKTYNLPKVKVLRKEPTEMDLELLFALNNLAMQLNKMATTDQGDPNLRLSTVEYIAGLARGAGIAFKTPVSKYAVPFPYGSTLEMLSAKHLGNPDRWHEIAALNGLKAPYVDEEGFALYLLANGNGNDISVGEVQNLYAGQTVYVSSTTVVKEKRHITHIQKLSNSQSIVSLDGESDLAKLKTLELAKLEAFLPDTVNSQQIIYIPSDRPSTQDDYTTKSIPGIDEHDPMRAIAGEDILLTPDNDIVITPSGDNRVATGMSQLVQYVRLVLSTVRGTLPRHAGWGLGVEPGTSLADLSAKDILSAAQLAFANDPTFKAIQYAMVNIKGPTAYLNLSLQVTGIDQLIPVSYEITR